jgi:CRP-like cAMP-binding protein|tara:strand:- start:315 stop:548 length:234 start_codon:yes stop_codon:yes gene_type:complete
MKTVIKSSSRSSRAGSFGEMGLIDGRPRSATLVAIEDCECSIITKEMFTNLPDSNPGIKAIKIIMEKRLKKLARKRF